MNETIHTEQTISIATIGFISTAFTHLLGFFDVTIVQITSFAIILLIDYVLGCIASYTLFEVTKEDKYRWKSSIAIRGLIAKIIIFALPAIGTLIEKAANSGESFITSSLLTIILLSEFLSIIRHLRVIKNAQPIHEVDVISYVYKYISNFLKRYD